MKYQFKRTIRVIKDQKQICQCFQAQIFSSEILETFTLLGLLTQFKLLKLGPCDCVGSLAVNGHKPKWLHSSGLDNLVKLSACLKPV